MKRFRFIGISYKTASIELRERISFSENDVKTFLRKCQELLGVQEALIVSTCNRTEIYYYAEQSLKKELCALIDLQQRLDEACLSHFQELADSEAVRHLYEVALGVDSMVLGDIQIINQVKHAYQWSADEEMAGPFMHRLLHSIFFTNKRVIQETELRDGTASVASVAVDIIKQYVNAYDQPRILILGLGEIGTNVAENLKDVDAKIRLVNRTKTVAVKVADDLNFEVGDFDALDEEIKQAHVIVSSVRRNTPLITAARLSSASSKLLVDLSVPRSIDDAVERNGMLLYNVDQLNERATEALKRRKKAVPAVQSIIDQSLKDFENWTQEMEVSPTIKKLKNALEEIRKQEMEKYLSSLSTKEEAILDKVTKGMIQKVMKLPVLQLKAACKRGEADTLVEVLNDLFNLEEKTIDRPE